MDEFLAQIMAQMDRQPGQTFGARDAAQQDSILADILGQQSPEAMTHAMDYMSNDQYHNGLVQMLGYKVPPASMEAGLRSGLYHKYNQDGSQVTAEQYAERKGIYDQIIPGIKNEIASSMLQNAEPKIYSNRAVRAEWMREQRNAQHEQRGRMREFAREAQIGEQEKALAQRNASPAGILRSLLGG